MSRLTKQETEQLSNGEECVICNHEKADCNDSCMYGRCKWNKKAIEKLKAYEDKEEQGLLLELPVAVGSPVYVVTENLLTSTIKTIEFEGHEYHRHIKEYCIGKCPFVIAMLEKFGKTVFLTRSEAEEALARMKGGK